ncbi:molecular chaperone [Salinivibrio sp. MA351]|uniref:Chaperone protein skp n=1 Tax=Salinivibrio costicola subsp. alcaliphilus TaxID=272773 RepID=A0ABX3KRK0_SALCS|nr:MULTISPECIES: OmpH family outer membrane protein [Salinivibrio]NUY56778.1 OmpH family outer membrane protein [Salinivibrio sp. EAGSL]OOE92162.1 molecular chaperone [Salinivibrio sp. AR640]OOE94106.1 molecular chaperone [Salinivibrio sp. AR647]OOE98239.1 molecular chaperone [Salinivibrio sp. MA351]OOF04143.1 molecular chaperone [Salinivibrio sp. MA607]
MKSFLKAAGLSVAVLTTSMYASAADAAQKVGYVSTGAVMSQLAQKNNLNEKLRGEFKDRVAEIERLKEKLSKGVEKLKRNGELMSEDERVKLQRELQSMESDYKLKVKALQEDQRKRGGQEESKLVQKLKKAVDKVAEQEGYDIVIDANAVLYANPSDDLSEKVINAVN